MPAPQLRAPDPPELPGTHLFDAETMEALTDEERKFALYTGARCPERKRNDIIMLLAEGRAIDGIARLVHVHRLTVANVANAFAVEIADYERRMPAKLKRTKWNLLDRIERESDQIPRQALGLTLKIVSDIEALDSGRFTARVDHVHRVDLFSDFGEFVRQLEVQAPIEQKNGADIHSSGGKKALMPGDAPAAAVIDLQPAQEPPAGPASDWKSAVSGLPTQASRPDTPTFTTDSPPAAPEFAALETAALDRAGGGSRAVAATDPSMDNGSPKFLGNGL
jgi:hypothetical protein